jgi:hypothetical protein
MGIRRARRSRKKIGLEAFLVRSLIPIKRVEIAKGRAKYTQALLKLSANNNQVRGVLGTEQGKKIIDTLARLELHLDRGEFTPRLISDFVDIIVRDRHGGDISEILPAALEKKFTRVPAVSELSQEKREELFHRLAEDREVLSFITDPVPKPREKESDFYRTRDKFIRSRSGWLREYIKNIK